MIILCPNGNVGIVVDGAGTLFVSAVGGRIFIEAVAIAEPVDPRPIVRGRDQVVGLEVAMNEPGGVDLRERVEHRDPLGLCGGKPAVLS